MRITRLTFKGGNAFIFVPNTVFTFAERQMVLHYNNVGLHKRSTPGCVHQELKQHLLRKPGRTANVIYLVLVICVVMR